MVIGRIKGGGGGGGEGLFKQCPFKKEIRLLPSRMIKYWKYKLLSLCTQLFDPEAGGWRCVWPPRSRRHNIRWSFFADLAPEEGSKVGDWWRLTMYFVRKSLRPVCTLLQSSFVTLLSGNIQSMTADIAPLRLALRGALGMYSWPHEKSQRSACDIELER